MSGVMLLLLCLAADNAELMALYDADQKDREGANINWNEVNPRDRARRQRVTEMLRAGLVETGKDYERAAMVFQHGESSDDILMAHVLAVTAIGRGNLQARWLAAAALDRLLQRLGQPQVFGTQFQWTEKDAQGKPKWTMEPYNRTLISDELRRANCVPGQGHQARMLAAIQQDKEPPLALVCREAK